MKTIPTESHKNFVALVVHGSRTRVCLTIVIALEDAEQPDHHALVRNSVKRVQLRIQAGVGPWFGLRVFFVSHIGPRPGIHLIRVIPRAVLAVENPVGVIVKRNGLPVGSGAPDAIRNPRLD